MAIVPSVLSFDLPTFTFMLLYNVNEVIDELGVFCHFQSNCINPGVIKRCDTVAVSVIVIIQML